MEEIKETIKNNPQISAAVITAIFGIVGILINIAINAYFRHQDYKNKQRITKLEEIDSYYSPLLEKINFLIEFTIQMAKSSCNRISDLVKNNRESTLDKDYSRFLLLLDELINTFQNGNYHSLDDYKLFLIHRDIKVIIRNIYDYSKKQSLNLYVDDFSTLSIKLLEFSKRIQICEIINMNNVLIRLFKIIQVNKNCNSIAKSLNINEMEDNNERKD